MSSDAIMEPSVEIKHEESSDTFNSSMFFEEGVEDDIEKDAATVEIVKTEANKIVSRNSPPSGIIAVKQESSPAKSSSMFFSEETKLKTEVPRTPPSKKVFNSIPNC